MVAPSGHAVVMGKWGERFVERNLQRRGMEVVERNWRCEHGELDLVVRDGDTLVVIEVKTRRTQSFGWPEEAVSDEKAEHLRAAGEAYLYHSGWAGPWRIDVASVERNAAGDWTVRWFNDAIQG